MSTRIFVANVHHSTTEDDVREMFSMFGTVDSVMLIDDRETGRPKGYGYVEMSSGAYEAIEALNGEDNYSNTLVVERARRGQLDKYR